ncbi:kinase-like protein [Artomyces pyxidatus]|uniref:Kinase-like protein n=1 Tax=Artomyces pyxidatus TaxID=48021 RepID=A0ACB8TCQ8_9AGAM|nr:kinase-like protein [Artomyces pyxidatus]
MQYDHPPSYRRSRTVSSALTPLNVAPSTPMTPTPGTPNPQHKPLPSMFVKRFSLTSKKNWWMVELDEDEDRRQPVFEDYTPNPPPRPPSPSVSPSGYNPPPRHPNSIFSFPTPAIYSAPPNSTASLAPFAQGSASELFKCIVKKPDVVQLEINGEMQSNATDVATQFLAELRVYTTVAPHRNLPAFLGCLDGIGMVLEFLDGCTLYDLLISARPGLARARARDFYNQLLDALTHIHAHGLSHGDLSLLNIQVTHRGTTLKLLDFGRSTSAASVLEPPDGPPVDPFAPHPRAEQIHPGTRPFCAPEILRGECQDARLADAYSFGMVLVCLERCALVDVEPRDQRKDLLPDGFLDGCALFGQRAAEYLRPFDQRRRLVREDLVEVTDD